MKKYIKVSAVIILIICVIWSANKIYPLEKYTPLKSHTEIIKTSIYFTESTDENTARYTKKELKMVEDFYTYEILSTHKSITELPSNYEIDDAKNENTYIESNVGIYNEDILEEFLENYENEKSAFLRILSYTDEGDPIIKDIKCDKRKIIILTDTTRDNYGNKEVTLYEYDGIDKNTLFQKLQI